MLADHSITPISVCRHGNHLHVYISALPSVNEQKVGCYFVAPSQVQFYYLSCLFYLKHSTCKCIIFLQINDWLTARPVQKLKRTRRLGSRGFGFWVLLTFYFFQEAISLNAGNSREVEEENGNSKGGVLDRVRATFCFIEMAKAISIFPFLCSIALPLYPQMNVQSLGSRKESTRDCVEKRTPHNPSRDSSSCLTFPCMFPLPTSNGLLRLCVATGSPQRSIANHKKGLRHSLVY